MIERTPETRSPSSGSNSITSYNAANLEKLKSNPKNKVVFPSQAELDEAQKLLAPVREEWVAASDRHKELKAALDTELAKVRARQQELTAAVLAPTTIRCVRSTLRQSCRRVPCGTPAVPHVHASVAATLIRRRG